MAKLIRAGAWRRLERPYTRKSKYRSKAFVRSVPVNKVVKFEMGGLSATYPVVVRLHSAVDVQIRHNALESARKSANRVLETKVGKLAYKLKFRVYPHHILRNNPLASGAGADRMSTGMKMSFGKAVGIAAQIRKDSPILEVHCQKKDIPTAKLALTRARHKFPTGGYLRVEELVAKTPAPVANLATKKEATTKIESVAETVLA